MSDTYMHEYKMQIYPNDDQKEIIDRLINLYMYVYNWGKSKEEEQYQKKKNGEAKYGFLNFYELCHEFKQFRDLPENAWLKELPLCTARLALRDIVQAFKDFFHRGFGYPKFKTKKRSPKMFKTRSDRFYIDGDQLRIEGLPIIDRRNGIMDTIDLHYDFGYRKSDGIKFVQPFVSIDDFGQYWVGFCIQEPVIKLNTPKSEIIGIDMGIRKTLTLSTGEIFNRPNNKIKKLDKRMRRTQRYVTRDRNHRKEEAERTKTKYEDLPVSNRAKKRAEKLRKLQCKITNIKKDFYHNTIKEIVTRNPEAIVIETLKVDKLRRRGKKYRREYRNALAHADFYTISKIVQDKCNKYGVKLIKAAEEYPSSQICSNCGHQQKIGSHVLYKCKNCGTVIDRDINAALNLRNYALVS